MKSEQIEIRGASTNNLKEVDVNFPLGKMSVVTGVSGSGKSSLVFDTLYGESYRRYVESLSSFARQYLKAMPKPKIKTIANLPPSIAVKQSNSGASSRSTVGTMTEVYDLMRILFSHNAQLVCDQCQIKIDEYNGDKLAKDLQTNLPTKNILILAPLMEWGNLRPKELKAQLQLLGFSRAFLGGAIRKIEEVNLKDLLDCQIVIDRIIVEKENCGRLSESLDLGFRVGRGKLSILSDLKSGNSQDYFSRLVCSGCGYEFRSASLALFSFNHPLGACQKCQGFGHVGVLDWDKVIAGPERSLADEGVTIWNFGRHVELYETAKTSARQLKIDFKKCFGDYSPGELKWLKIGDGKKFEGVDGYYRWILSKKHKPHYRIHAARFRKYVVCEDCDGARLNRDALSYRIGNENIASLAKKDVIELSIWLKEQELKLDSLPNDENDQKHSLGTLEATLDARNRLRYLAKMGLGYLSMDRLTRTLSGGEIQRIHMARCLGNALTETLYCLDEPTSGLHPSDSGNLVEVLSELKDQGNTLVIVEHERELIKNADFLVEIGPGAGFEGGAVVYAGETPKAPTKSIEWPLTNKDTSREVFFKFKKVKTHNLKSINVQFMVRGINTVCGVSGSGKSSLVRHSLFPALAKVFNQEKDSGDVKLSFEEILPTKHLLTHSEVVLVSQEGIGRSSRSNIATYLGIFDEIRKALASTSEAKRRGLTPGSFSFNTPGGRCENCKGLGTVVEDLSFLGEMLVICASCEGKRFDEAVLEVEYEGKNLIGILALTVSEARKLFFANNVLKKVFGVVIDMGLGYLTLGQTTNSFSGGEAQRLKLLKLVLSAKRNELPKVLIFDEPTTGLSDADVYNLIMQLKKLNQKGHTVIVVEHHTGMIRSSDWIIEIGPGPSEAGGRLVFQGEPLALRECSESKTAPFLWGKTNE